EARRFSLPPPGRRFLYGKLALLLWWLPGPVDAQEAAEGAALLRAGNYAEAVTRAEAELQESLEDTAPWAMVRIRALLDTGKYPEAKTAWDGAVALEPRHLPLKWLGREVLLANGQTTEAAELPLEIENFMSMYARRYRNAA